MVFNLYIFLGLQLILAICFFLFKPSKHQTTTYLKLPSKLHFFIMSLAVFLICIHINLEFQLFCIPVVWVKILLAIFCVSYLTFPFASQKVIQRLLAIPVSIGFFISIYTIVFGELWYPIWIVINIPLLFIIRLSVRSLNKRFDTKFFDCFMFYQHTVLAPFYLLYYTIQMTSPVYIKILSVSALFTFILFTILSLRISFLVKNIEHLETNKKPITSLLQNPVDSYLIDLILGAHWKYHTEFCPYDGWRPPYMTLYWCLQTK